MYSKGKWPLTHAAASDSATGLKNMPLASILKVEIPELHLLGRPPSKKSENEAAVNLGIGRAERAGHLCSCVAGRFSKGFFGILRGPAIRDEIFECCSGLLMRIWKVDFHQKWNLFFGLGNRACSLASRQRKNNITI